MSGSNGEELLCQWEELFGDNEGEHDRQQNKEEQEGESGKEEGVQNKEEQQGESGKEEGVQEVNPLPQEVNPPHFSAFSFL